LRDLGGQVFYQNIGNRLQWGAIGGRIPLMSGGYAYGDLHQGIPVTTQIIQRLYIDRLGGLLQYPFSITRRVELNSGYTRYTFDLQQVNYYPDSIIAFRLASPDAMHMTQSALAYVGDNSYFGFTSPAKGWRYRFEIEPTFGTLQYTTGLADYRHYFFANPVTFSVRGLFYGRAGKDIVEQSATGFQRWVVPPIYLGNEALIRGYSISSFSRDECPDDVIDCPAFDRLIGQRVSVANFEVRVPVLGMENYGLINFRFLPLELSAFFDAGVAWAPEEPVNLTIETDPEALRRNSERYPVFSTGLATRINLFGYLVGQVYYAYPFQRPDRGGHFGLVLAPGW
jgi:hypothetical protein